MACPTCDHTMSEMGCRTTDRPFFICPRCGTAKTCDGAVAAPALVDFCRSFRNQVFKPGANQEATFTVAELDQLWTKAGIREAINLPAARP